MLGQYLQTTLGGKSTERRKTTLLGDILACFLFGLSLVAAAGGTKANALAALSPGNVSIVECQLRSAYFVDITDLCHSLNGNLKVAAK